MKKMMMVAAATVAAWCSWGAESISVDKVSNHYPWDGKVDCVYTLSGAEAGYAYNGVFTLSVEKDGATIRRVVTNDLAGVVDTYTNTFDCTALFGAGYYPNGGIKVELVKKIDGVQLWAGGPYFARCNVGAIRPQEYGYYFWWGDTVGYKRNAGNTGWDAVDGSATGFEFFSNNPKIVTYDKKVSELRSGGYIDNNNNLVAKYDAAKAHLGASWRMMTTAELQTLTNTTYCTQTWTTDWKGTGVAGYVVTGATTGYTDKSIFIPAAGYGFKSSSGTAGASGFSWTSTRRPDAVEYEARNYGWCLFFNSTKFTQNAEGTIYMGMSVRPVRSAE